jgi:hypothetical protein
MKESTITKDYNNLRIFMIYIIIILIKSVYSLFTLYVIDNVKMDKNNKNKIEQSRYLFSIIINTLTTIFCYYILFVKKIVNIFTIFVFILFNIRILLNYTVGLDIYGKLFNIKPNSKVDKEILKFNDIYVSIIDIFEIFLVVYMIAFIYF